MSEKLRDHVVISLEERLTKVRKDAKTEPSTTPCFIFRVPQNLRLQLSPGDDTAYIPEVVSIGPFHAGHDCLSGMDYHKTRALNSILTRTNQPLAYYLDPMYELEQTARECYHGAVDMNHYMTFVEMMLLDGCFLLEIIRGHDMGFDQLGYSINDPVFTLRDCNNIASSIIKDLIKLENQIPFFVLEKLFDLQECCEKSGQLVQLVSAMFIKWLTGENLEVSHIMGKFLHCLHVFQYSLVHSIGDSLDDICLLEPSMSRCNNPEQHAFFHSVTDLIEYGIQFKRPKKGKRPFWDVKWRRNGVLEMPRVFINNRFKVVFQNLITFEQQCRKRSELRPVITEYVTLMDKLIKSGSDVGHLQQAGIIVHQLRNDAEVASLFNELGRLASVDPRMTSHYFGLFQQMNGHCCRWNQWKSKLKRTYFGNPWAVASLLAAIVLLFLAFFQTVYTVYPYYWPHSQY